MGSLYGGLTTALRPLLPLYLRARLKQGKEDPARLAERFGVSPLPRPAGRLIWLHGASVGETLSALPLMERLLACNPDLSVLVTSGTVTSAGLLAQRLPPRAFHQYIPLDVPAYAGCFLDHWRPDAVLWLESDLWPNLLGACRQRRIPAALINARLSDRSAQRWRRVRWWSKRILSTFQVILAQSRADAERLRTIGAATVQQIGNLKFTAPALAGSADSLSHLLATVGSRPRWIMASTHPGEEAVAAHVHRLLRQRWPELLTILVPRHPNRAESILAELGDLDVVRRSAGYLPGRDTAIYLADTLGELGTLYAAAPIACVGGSFTPKGGHNPIEPAQCGCAVLAGPDMSNFSDVAAELLAAQALVQVSSPEALAEEVARLIADPVLLATRQEAGRQITRQQERILSAVLTALTPVLAPAGVRGA